MSIEKEVEKFKPLPFLPPNNRVNRIIFYARIFFDLRLHAIYQSAKKIFPKFEGNVLDIGCGGQPWREMLRNCYYVGLETRDVYEQFGYSNKENLVYYDGKTLPFRNESIDGIVCTEVLEHIQDPVSFIRECFRCLKFKGRMYVTVPFSARYHYIPHDYWRFTPSGLQLIFNQSGFSNIVVNNLGSDLTAIVNKINLIILRLLFSRAVNFYFRIFRILTGIILLPVFLVLTLLGLVFLKLKVGAVEDPLGYEVILFK